MNIKRIESKSVKHQYKRDDSENWTITVVICALLYLLLDRKELLYNQGSGCLDLRGLELTFAWLEIARRM